MECYSFSVDHGELYLKVTSVGRNLFAGIESFYNKNWKNFPKVLVSGNWVMVENKISMRRSDPKVARSHHEVVRSMEAINRAFEAQLQFIDLSKPSS